MPDDKISVGLVVVFFITAILGIIYDFSYCAAVSWFLWLLFSGPIQRSYFEKKRAKLGITKADGSRTCITRKQYLLLYITSGILGSILNVLCVFFSISDFIILGMDIVLCVICDLIHGKMELSLVAEGQSVH